MAPRARTVPRKSPRQDRSKATVDAILDATARVLVQEGYDRASTNKIALRAGVSVGSIYQYFPSKEALVAALIDQHMEQMDAMFLSRMSGLDEKAPEQVVRDVIEGMISAHRVEPKLHTVITEQIPRVGRLQKLLDFNRDKAALIRAYLDTLTPRLLPKNLDAATFILISTVEAVTHAMGMNAGPDVDPDVLIDELTALVTRYLFGK